MTQIRALPRQPHPLISPTMRPLDPDRKHGGGRGRALFSPPLVVKNSTLGPRWLGQWDGVSAFTRRREGFFILVVLPVRRLDGGGSSLVDVGAWRY